MEMPVLRGVSQKDQRVLGEYDAGIDGPTIILTGGLHGNEPMGVVAIYEVLRHLLTFRLPMRGQVKGLAGNCRGLSRGLRFLSRDLNRKWHKRDIQRLLGTEGLDDSPEDHEQRELAKLFHQQHQDAREPLVFLDLHTTSATGAPFTGIADTLANRKIAFDFGVPVVLGLEEHIDGSMLGYLNDLGHTTVMFEGGEHTAESTLENLKAAIWITLVAAGALDKADVPSYHRMRHRLKCLGKNLPPVVEVRYRHVVRPEDAYQSRPGYRNFHPIRKRQVIGEDREGTIQSSEGGYLLMPLYQKQGEDGFFVTRQVSRFWLWLSAILRSIKADRLIPMLPGVSPHPLRPDRFRVNPDIARFGVAPIFHLFGYQRRQLHSGDLIFSRRQPPFKPPSAHLQ